MYTILHFQNLFPYLRSILGQPSTNIFCLYRKYFY